MNNSLDASRECSSTLQRISKSAESINFQRFMLGNTFFLEKYFRQ